MYLAVSRVKPLDGFKLSITFANGEERLFDCSPYLNMGKFKELRNISLFNAVTVRFDSIEWANHLDLDPEFLYEKSICVKKPHITSRSAGRAIRRRAG